MLHRRLGLVREPGGVRDAEVHQQTRTEHVQQEGEREQHEADADQPIRAARTVIDTELGTS
ncbi:MAG: hypothetical protein ACRDOI_34485 [Trebonia sp.]